MDSELGSSGSRKHSRTHPEVIDGSGSSKHSKSDSEVVEENRSDRHSERHYVVIDSSGRINHSTIHPEDKIDEGYQPATAKNLPSYAFSSSSDSSSEDFFQVDTIKIMSRAGTAPSKPDVNVQLTRKDYENGVTSNGSTALTSSSQASDLTQESVLLSMSPAQSPPVVQVMERSGNYDPYRIPASVFASKPTTPMEWSVASNESLFSIHVGNNSSSRDRFIMLGGDLHKSGEMAKSGESIVFNPTPPVKIVEICGNGDDKGKSFEPSGEACELIRDGHMQNADVKSKENLVPLVVSLSSSSNSKPSDGSGCSTPSFEYLKKKKRACRCCSNCSWTFCSCRWPFRYCSNRSWGFCSCTWPRCSCTCPFRYCSNCSWEFCSCKWPRCSCRSPFRCCCNCSWKCCQCKWPRCHCKWPSCHCCNCCQGFCHCWNCSRKGFCCCSSTILPDGMKSSVKVDSGQHTHQHKKKSASKCTSCTWFSCFSCCHRPRCSCCC